MHNIVLAHRILVTLFLLQYVVKLVLLLTNKKDELAKYTKATRIPEILVSVGFLVTGVWVLVQMGSSEMSMFMIIKLLCVFAAIPLAVIGFKKANKGLAVLAVALILAAYGLAEMNVKAKASGKVDTTAAKTPIEAGAEIYVQKNCNSCHGPDGKLGLGGAKDLSVTTLSMDEQKAVIKNGKPPMPPFSDLTDEQLKDLVEYLGTLRK
jgi:mono/diheme cytochrome c family protein